MSVAEFIRENCREFRAIRGNCRSDTLVVCGADGGEASIIRCVEDDCGVKRSNEEQGWFHNLARLEALEQIGNNAEIQHSGLPSQSRAECPLEGDGPGAIPGRFAYAARQPRSRVSKTQ